MFTDLQLASSDTRQNNTLCTRFQNNAIITTEGFLQTQAENLLARHVSAASNILDTFPLKQLLHR
jgi:hypothetical protein